MKKRMKTKASRRLLSLALSGAMVLSLLPVFAFAEERDGLCEHHPAHTPECGYVAAVEGQDCAHVCGDDCYSLTTACTHVHGAECYGDGVLPAEGEEKTADACTHICSEESGCVTKIPACVHTAHDEACGYAPAVEGQPCGFVCTECAAEESGEPQPKAACTLTQGCTLPDGHEGPCNAAPAHDCDGTLEPVEGDQGELLWACPVCGALLDAQGRELPAIRSISGTFNGSPAKLDENGNLVINADNFPDGSFRALVREFDTDSDGSLSEEEVGAVTYIQCVSKAISSLKGIEYFTALTKLACDQNQLTTLDVSKNTALIQLNCDGNLLTSLDVSSNTALELLGCSGNRLTSLDVRSNKALTILNCNDNQLTALDVSQNTKLTSLDCDINWLTELDVSSNTGLTMLGCGMNQLTTLDVSKNTALIRLNCDSNQLTTLDLSGNTALKNIGIGNQKTTGKYIWRGSAYLLDLSGIVGPDKLSRVSVTPEGAYDSATGMVTLEAPVNGEATVTYNFDTGRGSMDVTITATPNPNYLDLTDNHDFDGQTQVLVDGVAYPIETEGGRYVMLPDTGDLLTIYTYKQGSVHEQYPTGMGVYGIDRTDEGATAAKIDALDNLLQYAGCSIRVTGKRGIRMITALTKDNKNALTRGGLAGYTLAEYGTVVQWADTLGAQSLTLDTGKHNYAYKKGAANSVFATTDTLTQYTNVLVWDSLTNEQLGQDIVMRPYIILKDGSGDTVTLYGGTVSRSIGYIAYQNRAVFDPGTDAYQYVWEIIHAVYGDQYDSEYQG